MHARSDLIKLMQIGRVEVIGSALYVGEGAGRVFSSSDAISRSAHPKGTRTCGSGVGSDLGYACGWIGTRLSGVRLLRCKF